MGRLSDKGINGPFKGKVGKVSGSSRNGKHYIKGPTKKRTKKISAAEKLNRAGFSAAQYWLKPLLDFVREGFKIKHITSDSFITAKSYLMKNAVEGVKPDQYINPAKVKVSSGTLFCTEEASVELIEEGRLEFSWDTQLLANSTSVDQVMILAYDLKDEMAYFTTTGQFRHVGKDDLPIPRKKELFIIYISHSMRMTAAISQIACIWEQ